MDEPWVRVRRPETRRVCFLNDRSWSVACVPVTIPVCIYNPISCILDLVAGARLCLEFLLYKHSLVASDPPPNRRSPVSAVCRACSFFYIKLKSAPIRYREESFLFTFELFPRFPPAAESSAAEGKQTGER